jgi:hypothetical protein
VVARSRRPVAGYTWHDAPDGGATFPTASGGWVYTSNSEVGGGAGGCSAIVPLYNGVTRRGRIERWLYGLARSEHAGVFVLKGAAPRQFP